MSKLSSEEMLQEILKRSTALSRKRERARVRLLSGAVVLLLACLTGVVALFSGTGATHSTKSVYGAFLLSTEAGGYILVAVIAFAAGVALTALMMRHRRHTDKNT